MLLRSGFGKSVKPSAGSKSLTSLCIIEGDPVSHAAVSPIVRYSREFRGAQVQQTPFALGFAALRDAWELTWANSPSFWRQVRGPIGAMYLYLVRIGWTVPGFAQLE